jgi:hypothetical protein
VTVKPALLKERIQLLHPMAHVLERHMKLMIPEAVAEKKGGEKKRTKRKGQSATADTDKQNAGKSKTPPEKRDKAVELKGIPGSILADRQTKEVSLKCGKRSHACYKCWTKEPVVAKVAAISRKMKKTSAPAADSDPVPESKRVKTAGVAAVSVPVAPKLEPVNSQFEVEDSDPEIYS